MEEEKLPKPKKVQKEKLGDGESFGSEAQSSSSESEDSEDRKARKREERKKKLAALPP